jgi:hypothetical protein
MIVRPRKNGCNGCPQNIVDGTGRRESRRQERNRAEHARADAVGDRLDRAAPANLAAVRKLLDERGLLLADEFDNRVY